jgi:hypothetical protein
MGKMKDLLALCPQCGKRIKVPVVLSLGKIRDGNQEIDVEPNLNFVWKHYEKHVLSD